MIILNENCTYLFPLSLTIEPKLNGIEIKITIRLVVKTTISLVHVHTYAEGRNQNNWWPTLHQICFTRSETTVQHCKKEKNSPKARWFLHILYSSKNVHDSNVFSDFLQFSFKVHIFWVGHKILRNFHQLFVLCSASQIIGGDFAKFCGLIIYELYLLYFFKLCFYINGNLSYEIKEV